MAARRSSESKCINRRQSPWTPRRPNDFPTLAPQSFVLFPVRYELGACITDGYKADMYDNACQLRVFGRRRDKAGVRGGKGGELQVDAVLCGVVKWRRILYEYSTQIQL